MSGPECKKLGIIHPYSRGVLRLKRGRQLGKYRLEKKLGAGGFCEVWKAKDTVENISVALKIPQAGLNGERDNKTIFREVALVAQLRHPHIMPLKNADIIEGHAILATELSTGTLDDCSKPMSPKRILSIITQILDGLSHAHRSHMVHCDVTPGNIFLFPDGRAALGDFGISVQLKGRVVTVDEFGTPGYVAPEQAYGKPSYYSDCFSVGLILYEYLTGVLPRWPFRWPFKGYDRLRQKTNMNIVRFLQRALQVDPALRFKNAGEMLEALQGAIPASLKNGHTVTPKKRKKSQLDWRAVRRDAFVRRYSRVFPEMYHCMECGEPIEERMGYCPWCGSDKNRFDSCSEFSHVCTRCHKGVLPEWSYCPWCYGAGFDSPYEYLTDGVKYDGRCEHCGEGVMRFMRYCPWCHRKVKKAWQVHPFPEVCGHCDWSVDSSYWDYCPWCSHLLLG